MRSICKMYTTKDLKKPTNFKRYTSVPLQFFEYVGIKLCAKPNWFHKILFYLTMGNICFLIVLQLIFLIKTNAEFMIRATAVSYINYFFVVLGKILSLRYNKRLLEGNFEILRCNYPQADMERNYKLERYLRIYLRAQKVFLGLFHFIMLFCCSLPLMLSLNDLFSNGVFTYRLVVFIWFPYNLAERSIFWYIVCSVLTIWASFAINVINLSSDLLLYGTVSQLSMHFDCLSKQIHEIDPKQPDSVQKLKFIIEQHQQLLHLAYDINIIFTPAILFSLLAASFIMCLSGYQILGDIPFVVVIKVIALIVFEMKHVIITCYFGDKLREMSSQIFDAVYTHNWVDGSMEYKRLVLLIMLRSQHGSYLNVAGISDVSLITLKTVLSFSYRAFTVLKTA